MTEVQKRARKTRAAAKAPASVTLINALRFTQSMLAAGRRHIEQHNLVSGGWCVGFDGTITAGYPIVEEMHAFPHAQKLLAALERCTEPPSITQLNSGQLRVKAGKFSALVACLPNFDEVGLPSPDPAIAPCSDKLKTSLQIVAPVAVEAAARVILAAVKVGEGSAEATNGYMLFESWHGHSMPLALLPRRAVNAICKHASPLVAFGYSGRSLTFYYEDGAFVKTQLYEEKWPDTARIWPAGANPWPVPTGLFEAVAAVRPFAEGEVAYLSPEGVRSHADAAQGACYAVEGLPVVALNADCLAMLAPHTKTLDFAASADKAVFFGDNFRALLMHVRSK